jgi:hypothetical protein
MHVSSTCVDLLSAIFKFDLFDFQCYDLQLLSFLIVCNVVPAILGVCSVAVWCVNVICLVGTV